jgi:Protein of unknown function (DUF4232)
VNSLVIGAAMPTREFTDSIQPAPQPGSFPSALPFVSTAVRQHRIHEERIMSLPWRVAAITAIAAATVSSLVAACSTATDSPGADAAPTVTVTVSPDSPSAPVRAQPGTTAPVARAACRTGSLLITVDDSQADGTAGASYYPLDFMNTGSTACEMYGYPGVSFAAAPNGTAGQIGAAAVRSRTFAKLTVRLTPGGTAHAWLKVTMAGNYPASVCQPVTANWLRIYPPEEAVAGYVAHAFRACAGTSAALLTILPVRAGQAVAGSTP